MAEILVTVVNHGDGRVDFEGVPEALVPFLEDFDADELAQDPQDVLQSIC